MPAARNTGAVSKSWLTLLSFASLSNANIRSTLKSGTIRLNAARF